jgi:hypothetical protein
MFPSRDVTATAAHNAAGEGPGRSGTAGSDSIGDLGSSSPDDQAGGSAADRGTGINGGKGGPSATGSLFGGPAGRGGRQGGGGASRPATLGGSASGFGGDGGSGDGDQPPELMLPDSPDKISGVMSSGGSGGNGFAPTLRPLSRNSGLAIDQNPFDLSGGNSAATGGSSTGNSRVGARSSASSGEPSSSGSTSSNSSASDGPGSSGLSLGNPATANASSGGSASSVQMGGPGANISLGSGKKAKPVSKDDDPDAGPRISEDDGKSGGPRGRPQGPRKWGQVGKKATNGFEKKIEIRLLSERILVGSKDVAIPVKRSDSHDEIVGRVANAIDYVADKWGEPPPNYYWVPAVRFVVYPGGEKYYEKLSHVLEQKYGVHSTVDFSDDKPAKKTISGGRP